MKKILLFLLFLCFLIISSPALALNVTYFDNDYGDDGFVQSSNFEKYFGGNVRYGDSGGAAEWEYGLVPEPLSNTLVQNEFTWPDQGSHHYFFIYNPSVATTNPDYTGVLGISLDNDFTNEFVNTDVLGEITGDVNSLAIRAKATDGRTANLNEISLYSLTEGLIYETSLVGDSDAEYIMFSGDELTGGFIVLGTAELFGSNSDGDRAAYQFKVGQVPVPEPATMLLLGIGLIGLAGIGKKKFKN